MPKQPSKKRNEESNDIEALWRNRFASADFIPGGEESRRVFQAAFLDAVSRLVPQVVASLRGEVLPVYLRLEALAAEVMDANVADSVCRQYTVAGASPVIGVLNGSNFQSSGGLNRLIISWSTLRAVNAEKGIYPDFLPLRVAMEEWAAKFNMAEQRFFLDSGMDTLRLWAQIVPPEEGDGLAIRGRAWFPPVSSEERRFELQHDGWQADSEPLSYFADRLEKEFREKLDAYKSRITKLMEERGWEKVPSFYRPEFIEWLALFQCGNQTQKQIESRVGWGREITTVSKGIRKAAQLVGIRLRTSGRGRPRKGNKN